MNLTEVTMNDYNGGGVGCVMTTAQASFLCLASAHGNSPKDIYHQNLSHCKGVLSSTDDVQTLAENEVAKMTLDRAFKGSDSGGSQVRFHPSPSVISC